MEPSSIRLNDNTWHKVHITRVDRSVRIVIDDGVVNCEFLLLLLLFCTGVP